MKSSVAQLSVPLSHLVPSRRNPRKVKPSRQSHDCLVSLIKAYGLLQPLVVRPIEGKPKDYEVLAGHRRLRALREIHRGDGDPKIPCILQDVDAVTADALSLGENFGREAMHPLDEAEAFAKLAAEEAKGVEVIAADFGVTDRYVRQRMRLASLSELVKTAYRGGEIDTATAEAFASVPMERQTKVWQEMNGHPRHAEHVRNVIANDWIDAAHALFDVSTLPDSAVSRDLFSERVLIERQAFMAAQIEALGTERIKLVEDGWSEVVAGRYEDIHDRILSKDLPEREFDDEAGTKLEKIAERREKLEAKWREIPDGDEKASTAVQQKLEALEAEEQEIEREAPIFYSEATKAIASVFLMLSPDGQVQREYRVPRRRPNQSGGGNGHPSDGSADGGRGGPPAPPTSDDLSDKQLAVTFTHQALSVREAVLKNATARKRILALILHDKVRSEGLAIRHEPNGTTVQAANQGFASPAYERLMEKRTKIDPFVGSHFVEDGVGYEQLGELSSSKLDALIDLLTIECITAHLQRRTELVQKLADQLKVNVREDWRPDAIWLAHFQKIQLSHLIIELRGAMHAPAPERKKSELVETLAKLFADAAEDKLEDKQLAEKVNRWLPSNLTEVKEETAQQPT
jgi:ParB family transcriptional regulator, chromosome partitioning protein